MKYPKIQSVYKRDPDNNYKTFLEGDWSCPEFGILQDILWSWTEKIDGTNIRIMNNYDGNVRFGARTDEGQIPARLLEHLQDKFDVNTCNTIFPYWEDSEITIFGEGYGAKIQKGGGNYRKDQGFILFDVNVNGIWLERESLEEIAQKFDIPIVSVIAQDTIEGAIGLVASGFWSDIAEEPRKAEGLVGIPPRGLLNRNGGRIITKIKTKDFV